MVTTWGITAFFIAGAAVFLAALWIGPLAKNAEGKRFALRCFILPAMVAAFLAAGYFAGSWRADHFDMRKRAVLERQGSSVADAINPDLVKMLSWSADDRLNPAFTRLGHQLASYVRAAGTRSIYTMAMREGRIVFGPESLAENDPMASSPGTPYEEPPAKLLSVFESGEGLTIGPYSDEYGTFVSTFRPVKDPATGGVLAVAGLDIEAFEWKTGLQRARLAPLLAAILFSIAFTSWGSFAKRRSLSGCPQVSWREGVFLVFFAGALLTTAMAMAVKDREDEARNKNFAQLSAVYADSIGDSMREIRRRNMALMTAAFEMGHPVGSGDFAALVRPLIGDAAVMAYEWIPRPADVSGPLVSSLVEPPAVREKLAGFDHSSDPARMKAMEDAMKSSLPTVAGPASLVESGGEEGLVFLSPVFEMSAAEGDVERRRVAGFIAAAVSPEKLLQGVLIGYGGERDALGVCLYEFPIAGAPREVASCLGDMTEPIVFSPQFGSQELTGMFPVFAFGKTFVVVTKPGPAYVSAFALRIWWIVLAVGFILTSIVALTVGIMGKRRKSLEEEVAERTAELTLTRERFAQMAELSREIIWETDAEGLFTYVSRACVPVLGYEPGEIVGRMHFYDLHPEEGREEFKRRALEAFKRRSSFKDLPNVVVAKDGTRVDVFTNGAPVVSPDGTLEGYRGSDRDVTERVAADAALKKRMEEGAALTKLMVGREQRIIELKEEINALLRELGRETKYGS